MIETSPLIVTLALDDASFEYLDALRRAHFPPERNHLTAHLTLFHRLPGEQESAIAHTLRDAAGRSLLALRVTGLRSLGRGVAFAIDSAELAAVRARLASEWFGWLGAQDRQPFRPHVTVQNKAAPEAAKALYDELTSTFEPFEGIGVALELWRYRGGPWEPVERFAFRPAIS